MADRRAPGVPTGRGRATQPGGDRRTGRRHLADAADGPAVPGGRCRPSAVPGPPGLGAGTGPRKRSRGA